MSWEQWRSTLAFGCVEFINRRTRTKILIICHGSVCLCMCRIPVHTLLEHGWLVLWVLVNWDPLLQPAPTAGHVERSLRQDTKQIHPEFSALTPDVTWGYQGMAQQLEIWCMVFIHFDLLPLYSIRTIHQLGSCTNILVFSWHQNPSKKPNSRIIPFLWL